MYERVMEEMERTRAAIRASGTHCVPAVAVIIACADPRSIGPCSRSTMIQSSPERAMICTVCMLGMVAIAPKVGRPFRHSSRNRLRGAGVAGVKWMLRLRREMAAWKLAGSERPKRSTAIHAGTRPPKNGTKARLRP